jgi:hypothetical protein
MSVVNALLAGNVKRTHRENKGYLPVQTGIFIHVSVNIVNCVPLLSLPKDLLRS